MGKLNKLVRQNKVKRHSNVYFTDYGLIAKTIYYYIENRAVIFKRTVNYVYTEQELIEKCNNDDCFIKDTDFYISEDTIVETVQQYKVYFRTMRNGHHC